jgi:transcription termination factor Rho
MAVLNRTELERSPLADLHAIASELGVEGFRRLRRDELVDAIVEHYEGSAPDDDSAEAGEDTGRRSRTSARREGAARAPEAARPQPSDREDADARAASRGGRRRGDGEDEPDRAEREPEREEPTEPRSGVLDALPNGGGFLRGSRLTPAREDPYVSPAQVRRCELRPGDEVGGPVRPPRRSERHPSLVRVETVNGGPAEPPAERPRFEDLPAAYATERLAVPDELALPPIGRGSRVAIADPPGAEGGALLRRLVVVLREADASLDATVALVGARPEDVRAWRESGVTVGGGGADEPADEQARAAELALARAKRVAERGADALVAVDSLGALPPDAARRLFAAARRLEGVGSLTVIATLAPGDELARLATTRILLEPGAGARGSEPPRATLSSDTVRADLLGA